MWKLQISNFKFQIGSAIDDPRFKNRIHAQIETPLPHKKTTKTRNENSIKKIQLFILSILSILSEFSTIDPNPSIKFKQDGQDRQDDGKI
jgi:hypothetical protein